MSDTCCSYSLITYPLPAPTGLAATPTDDSITLTWDAVEGAVNYTITWSGGGESGTQTVTGTTATITGLTAGTQYTIAVVANPAAGGEDVPSAPALITVTTTGAALPTPTGFSSSAITATAATVSWSAVAGADRYSVTYTPGGTTPQVVTSPTVNLTGLTAETTYTVSVVAQDSTGGASDSAAGTTQVTTTA